MKTFSPEVRESVYKAQNGFCCVKGCYEQIHSFHHALPNTKPNQRLFPLFLQSPFNCKGTCNKHHDERKAYPEMCVSYGLAEVYENYLRSL